MSEFSKRFKDLREAKGMTQDRIAEILGISRSTVAGYESEDKSRVPREETLTKIANLFGTTIDYLLGRTNDKSSYQKDAAEKLIDYLDMELTDEEIIERMNFKVDNLTLSNEEVKEFIAFVRAKRFMKSGPSASASKHEGPSHEQD